MNLVLEQELSSMNKKSPYCIIIYFLYRFFCPFVLIWGLGGCSFKLGFQLTHKLWPDTTRVNVETTRWHVGHHENMQLWEQKQQKTGLTISSSLLFFSICQKNFLWLSQCMKRDYNCQNCN